MHKIYLLSYLLFLSLFCSAQTDSTKTKKWGKIEVGGLLDTYYGFCFNQPDDKNIPYFVNSARHNELNINVVAIDVKYTHDRLRARLMPGFGSYFNANNANEPATLRHLLEATAGVRPFGKKQIWIDAGVFISPYTNEGPISKDHLMYTRSLLPEYVPYYIAALRVSVPITPKITGNFYVMNGWQQIIDVNKHKSFGSHFEFKIKDKHTLNWTTYLGDERSDAAPLNRMRYFSDVSWLYNMDGRLSATACAYVGLQRRLDTLTQKQTNHVWAAANAVLRYKFHQSTSLSLRAEYFYDPDRVQITPITSTNTGFHVFGAGLCLNIHLFDNAMFRLEGRGIYSLQNRVFLDRNQNEVPWFGSITSSFAIWF